MALEGRKALVLITGASRGIGKEIAVQLASILADESHLILSSRRDEDLKLAVQDIQSHSLSAGKRPRFTTISCDLGKVEEKLDTFRETLSHLVTSGGSGFELFLLVHNAGSIGSIEKRAINYDNEGDEFQDYLKSNVTSMIQLTSAVFGIVTPDKIKHRTVVNITSMCAAVGVPSFAQYSTGKAAREGFLRVLAAEEPSIRVISYSPGPVDTDMAKDVVNRSCDEEIREQFKIPDKTTVREMLSTESTVRKLVKILNKDEFKSSGRMDYYDDEY